MYRLAGSNNMVKPYLILNALIFHSGVSLTLNVSDSLGCPITSYNNLLGKQSWAFSSILMIHQFLPETLSSLRNSKFDTINLREIREISRAYEKFWVRPENNRLLGTRFAK